MLGAIVLPATAFVMSLDPEIESGGATRPQIIRDHPVGNEAIFLHKFVHQFQCGMLLSLGLNQHTEDLAFSIDRSSKIDHAAIDFR